MCVRGFVFLGVCCLFEIGAGLSRVSMPPCIIIIITAPGTVVAVSLPGYAGTVIVLPVL